MRKRSPAGAQQKRKDRAMARGILPESKKVQELKEALTEKQCEVAVARAAAQRSEQQRQ